jgi:Ca2+-binding EF-hand superfamily protein
LTRDGEDIKKWFNLFNENKSARLDKSQINDVIVNAKFNVPDRELDVIIELLDNTGDKKIKYLDLCDLVEGNMIPNYVLFV